MGLGHPLRSLFVAFALLVQVLLLADFAARNWRPVLEKAYGWLVYAMAIPGLALGLALLVMRAPWYLVAAPGVYAVWAAFGYVVDIRRPTPWRSPPRWAIFVPYVTLFLASLFLLWIPLWYISSASWIAYTALYAAHTSLNLCSHFRPRRVRN